jgi:molybdopterin converting factor small subunit
MATVTVRYWAAAKAAAGVAEEQRAADTVADLVDAAGRDHGPELARVLLRCSVLVDGTRAARDTVLADGAVVEVLPPFAGG